MVAAVRRLRDNRRVSPDDVTAATPSDIPSDTASDTAPGTAARAVLDAPRSRPVDATLAAAVHVARAAALDVGEGGTVGDHLGVEPDGDRVATHSFACLSAGYRGWRWAVTVARAPRSRTVTVSEVHLLPAAEAVLSPGWLPWAERIRPGDLGPGMVLPRVADDVRLEQGYEATGDGDGSGDGDVDAVALWELGLGRPRVLSLEGRDEAAQRWYAGAHGPRDPFAEQAPAPCASCGFLLPMAGALRAVFGVCANEWSPSDGQVVSYDHGCGAHSESDAPVSTETVDPPVLDETGYEQVDIGRTSAPAGAEPGTERAAEPGAEPGAEPDAQLGAGPRPGAAADADPAADAAADPAADPDARPELEPAPELLNDVVATGEAEPRER